LVVAPLGESKKVRVGDEIFIVGAPYGINHTLTVGHISGKRKPENLSDQLVPIEFLQTDAAVNQGNSGGPMFNMAGEVIGIVSSILTRSGGFEGIGFAASIDNAKELLLEQRPFWTGLELLFVKGDLAKILNLPQKAGFLIQRVTDLSPGYRLGFRPGKIPARIQNKELMLGGDIILKIGDITISDDMHALRKVRKLITDHPNLKNIEFTILREGKIESLLKK
jgi:serine protease Do